MQECCKAAPRRARHVVIALVVAGAIAAGLLGPGGEGQPPAATQTGKPR